MPDLAAIVSFEEARPGVKHVRFPYGPRVTDLAPLAALPELAEVRIDHPRKLDDPSALGALPALRKLRYRAGTMTRLGFVPSIGFLRGHPRFEVLELIDTEPDMLGIVADDEADIRAAAAAIEAATV
jgi:hypothetical protein